MLNKRVPVEIITVFQIVLIVFILTCLLYLLKHLKIKKYERRLRKHVINDYIDNQENLLSKVECLYLNFENKLAKFLLKIKIFNKYSKRYLMYINRTKRKQTPPINYVSRKIIISIAFALIIIISNVIRGINFSLLQILLSMIVGFYMIDIFSILTKDNNSKKIEDELYKAVSIMNNSFKAGKSIMQAIEVASIEVDGPLKEEFSYMLTDLKCGLDLDEVLNRFNNRVNIDEVKYMTTSLIVLNKTGGDIVEIFQTIEDNILKRKKLKQELKMLTASSKLTFKILVSMPILTVIFIYTLNPSYFNLLVTNKVGNLILACITILYFIYIYIIRKVMKVEGI